LLYLKSEFLIVAISVTLACKNFTLIEMCSFVPLSNEKINEDFILSKVVPELSELSTRP
jgi:hypothetical protein